MTKLKQIEEALEASLLALRFVHRLVNAAGDRDLIRLVDEAIAACKDALHDPDPNVVDDRK
jgi:precorrin isomerase